MKNKDQGARLKAQDERLSRMSTGLRFVKGILSQKDRERLLTHLYKPFTLSIFPKQREDDSYFLEIVAESSDGVKKLTMSLGDTFTFTHDFNYEGEIDEPDFPMSLFYKGTEYKLNKTKQGKLILTK